MGTSEGSTSPPLATHLLLVALPIGVAALFLDGSLFGYHASLLATAYPFFMVEGALLAAGAKGRQRVLLLRCHLAVQLLASASSAMGFLAIYRNKDAGGKPHFATLHSYAALATLALTAIVNVGGALAFFRLPQAIRKHGALIRRYHKLAGTGVVLLGLSTCVLGLQTHKPSHPLHKGVATYALAFGMVASAYLMVQNSTTWKGRRKASNEEERKGN